MSGAGRHVGGALGIEHSARAWGWVEGGKHGLALEVPQSNEGTRARRKRPENSSWGHIGRA